MRNALKEELIARRSSVKAGIVTDGCEHTTSGDTPERRGADFADLGNLTFRAPGYGLAAKPESEGHTEHWSDNGYLILPNIPTDRC